MPSELVHEVPLSERLFAGHLQTFSLPMEAIKPSRKVKRTERGWGAHYICAEDCRFRRNTLLECEDTRVVVSTVGNYTPGDGCKTETIGSDRYYETMVFHAEFEDPYWDADVSRQITCPGKWKIATLRREADHEANLMHEDAVEAITQQLLRGIL